MCVQRSRIDGRKGSSKPQTLAHSSNPSPPVKTRLHMFDSTWLAASDLYWKRDIWPLVDFIGSLSLKLLLDVIYDEGIDLYAWEKGG